MLRSTQSPSIFIQQLGRGIRKADGKEYVVVLDFIGNYNNNFMIPIALSGDRTYNKDNVRRYLMEGGRLIPGASTVHFDEISRKRIFTSIDNANFSDIRLIKESYINLKDKLGRVPSLMDFETYGSIDPMRIFDNGSLGSYHKFLKKYEKSYEIEFDKHQENVLEYISKKFASGKRIHELLMLKRLLAYQHAILKLTMKELKEDYKITVSEKTRVNVVSMLTNEFATGSSKSTYSDCVFIEPENEDFRIRKSFAEMLKDEHFYKQFRN